MRTRIEFLVLLVVALAGCAGPTFEPDSAPSYVVTAEETPLYRYGPQQGGAPEAHLRRDDSVRMLRRELGFSLVLMSDGMTGYVANEALAPAPPELVPPPPNVAGMAAEESPVPLPVEPPLPGPDLDASPVDAPPGG